MAEEPNCGRPDLQALTRGSSARVLKMKEGTPSITTAPVETTSVAFRILGSITSTMSTNMSSKNYYNYSVPGT